MAKPSPNELRPRQGEQRYKISPGQNPGREANRNLIFVAWSCLWLSSAVFASGPIIRSSRWVTRPLRPPGKSRSFQEKAVAVSWRRFKAPGRIERMASKELGPGSTLRRNSRSCDEANSSDMASPSHLHPPWPVFSPFLVIFGRAIGSRVVQGKKLAAMADWQSQHQATGAQKGHSPHTGSNEEMQISVEVDSVFVQLGKGG